MNKIRDFFEVFTLISLFVVSIIAITPIV